jgi:hypothetical protein
MVSYIYAVYDLTLFCNSNVQYPRDVPPEKDLPWPDKRQLIIYNGLRCRYASVENDSEVWEELLRCDPTGEDNVSRSNGLLRKTRKDDVLIWRDYTNNGAARFTVARLLLLFQLSFHGKTYDLAYVQWFNKVQRIAPNPCRGFFLTVS